MKKTFLFFVFGLLLFSCAPLTKCSKYQESIKSIPNNFEADGYVSYGILKYPIVLVKDKNNYTLRTFLGNLDFTNGNLCVYGTCIDIPIDVSKLIYGDVIDKDDTISCEDGYTVYTKKTSFYTKKVYIKDGKLYKMEILKPDNTKQMTIYFKDKDNLGYYKNLVLENNNFDINIYINKLRSI